MLADISTSEDVKCLVDVFYEKVRTNDLIGPIFNEKIGNDWNKHLLTMYGFWETILFDVQKYSGSPFLKHASLPIEKQHFDTWLTLFNETVNEHFKGEKATEAKWRAARMGEMFQYKLEYQRANNTQSLK